MAAVAGRSASVIGKKVLSQIGLALGNREAGYQVNREIGAVSKEILGYDFWGLLTKLFFYFLAALIIAKFFEAIRFGGGIASSIAGVFGYHLPSALPQWLSVFIDQGITYTTTTEDGTPITKVLPVKYWDVIKLVAFALVLAEMYQYIRTQSDLGGKPSPLTLGIFGTVSTLLLLTSVPELWEKLKAYYNQVRATAANIGGTGE